MPPYLLWLLLRVLTSLIAAVVSSIRPVTPLEMRLPLLPPTPPLLEWLDRVFLSPWIRWDVDWYQRIVTNGYSATDGTAQFHPLYPWLAIPLVKIGVSPVLSLILVSSLAGAALFYSFYKLASLDLSPRTASYALMLFAFAPIAFILFAPYSEALFLLFAVLCLFFARQKKWWLAGFLGALATLTRQQGLFLLIPVAWELWESSERKAEIAWKKWLEWLSLLLIPAGYILWLFYRAFLLHDELIKTSNIQQFIYSFFVSPSASKVVPSQEFLWPWQAIYLAISKLFTHPDVDMLANISLALIFLIVVIITWNKMRLSYRLYTLAITLLSFSYYTGQVHPYMGLPRHLYVAFPIFIGLAVIISKPWIRLLILGLSAFLMLFFMETLYVLLAWVP